MSELSKAEFEQKLVELASGDAKIREQLISDPTTVIEEMLGMELPEETKVMIHEEDANTLHFVLPSSGDELSEAELAGVAGGVCWENSTSAPP